MKRSPQLGRSVWVYTASSHGGPELVCLGQTDTVDQAIGDFAVAYADQNAKDHATLVAAVKAGRIKALVEEES